MKKLLSTNYSDGAFNIATFVLRATLGLLLFINHGYAKLTNFNEMQYTFFDPLHIGHRWSLVMSVFAEVFASLLLVLGLFSRVAAFVLVINMCAAVFLFHFNQGQSLKQAEMGILYLSGFVVLLLTGPGRFSVDGMAGK